MTTEARGNIQKKCFIGDRHQLFINSHKIVLWFMGIKVGVYFNAFKSTHEAE